ncbi:hypothetical protein [Geothrix fuzhouensis]|uniref:hypothetical protein n=1 Tax=Geothrix fuzhouensis TaxID=2966451 RepID=UPI002148565F|nr:hypothetical protein [Geothrix fuzhouensis]
MFSIRLLSPVIALFAAQTGLATETWDAASSRLQAHVEARQGHGAIVQIERVDAQTVRVSLKALWPRFLRASFQGGGDRHRLCQLEGRGSETIIGTAAIDPQTTYLDVRLHGSDFNPKIRLRLPALGQTEVDTVLMDGNPDA